MGIFRLALGLATASRLQRSRMAGKYHYSLFCDFSTPRPAATKLLGPAQESWTSPPPVFLTAAPTAWSTSKHQRLRPPVVNI
ncbi:hypothetical protein BJ085DRAFT_41608 [Dimargaris cristalligena]|uniref:Uncharacterized protein n=1 Tax=Dimargaris cristalligena TaxID=215637 RepID=A0A4P9ZJE0_9FUNG|nr:hypothetical protein BJ085DRAFT_41608 [Dimargaris cristalligena]|eukprot:RKP33327.1 hypothetical protein BJ085DRAFT_41608 [Dimargaris cristalligena]